MAFESCTHVLLLRDVFAIAEFCSCSGVSESGLVDFAIYGAGLC